jgi:hypothetical protein
MRVPTDLNGRVQLQKHGLLEENCACHSRETLYLVFLQSKGGLVKSRLCKFDDHVVNVKHSTALHVLQLRILFI